MKCYPAIDIYNGKGVRLIKGDFNQVTVYGSPQELLEKWLQKGAKQVHVVDLNGAKQEGNNVEIILKLLASDVDIQIGGGIRNLDQAEAYLRAGARMVVIGTAAVKDPQILKRLHSLYPGRIAVGIDARDGYVSMEGWLEDSKVPVSRLVKVLKVIGIKRIIYTDITRDGMLMGPNFEMYKEMVKNKALEIVASGGVTNLSDVRQLEAIGVYGVIVGKALYEQTLDMKAGELC